MKLAARGQRDMDAGAELITDPVELSAIRRRARGVQIKSLVLASILTALLLLL